MRRKKQYITNPRQVKKFNKKKRIVTNTSSTHQPIQTGKINPLLTPMGRGGGGKGKGNGDDTRMPCPAGTHPCQYHPCTGEMETQFGFQMCWNCCPGYGQIDPRVRDRG